MTRIVKIAAAHIGKNLSPPRAFVSKAAPVGTIKGEEWLGPLSRLNVIVGPNNTGKSRLLRTIMAVTGPGNWYAPQIEAYEEAVKKFEGFVATLQRQANSHSWVSSIRPKVEALSPGAWCREGAAHHVLDRINALKQALREYGRDAAFRTHGADPEHRLRYDEALRAVQMNMFDPDDDNAPVQRWYIPSLRSLRRLSPKPADAQPIKGGDVPSTDLLEDIAAADYKILTKSSDPYDRRLHVSIATGQNLYDEVQERLLGTLPERNWVRDYESFLSEKFFLGAKVAIIPRLKSTLHIKIGNEEERPIHELGDGIQQVILMTYPFRLAPEKNNVLFIEEPELYLHPGFQRALIEAWLSETSSLQVFVATHSSQFLDLTLDHKSISVFRCTKALTGPQQDAQSCTITVTPALPDGLAVLHDLGMRNSAVLLSNCTIWVEGVTDRMYLRHWLKLYQESLAEQSKDKKCAMFMEDVHFSFVEFGGANLPHWSIVDDPAQVDGINVKRLCGEVFLIVDADDNDAESAKGKRYAKLKALMNDRFYLLPGREIENLLSPEVLVRVVKAYEGDTAKLNANFEHSAYLRIGVGEFIQEAILTAASQRPNTKSNPYSAPSGTIKDKRAFAERAIQQTKTWSDVSSYAKDLTKAVLDFVKGHN